MARSLVPHEGENFLREGSRVEVGCGKRPSVFFPNFSFRLVLGLSFWINHLQMAREKKNKQKSMIENGAFA